MNIFKLVLNAGKLIKLERDVEQLIRDVKNKAPFKGDIAQLIGDLGLILESGIFDIADAEKAEIKIALDDIKNYAGLNPESVKLEG